jgi:hypothetical protein
MIGKVKKQLKKTCVDVEIIITDGTSEMLNVVKERSFDPGMQSNHILLSK